MLILWMKQVCDNLLTRMHSINEIGILCSVLRVVVGGGGGGEIHGYYVKTQMILCL